MVQSTSEPGETTTEKYRISRAEFGKIINRNLRGLQKLMRLELADAKNVKPLRDFLFIPLFITCLLAITIHDR